MLNGEESTMTGTLNATWPGDTWKTGGGATWLGGSYDADTDTLVFGTGNPAPWNSHLRNAGGPTEGNTGDTFTPTSRSGHPARRPARLSGTDQTGRGRRHGTTTGRPRSPHP